MPAIDSDSQRILGVLAARGMASSRELQAATGKSQATVSRELGRLSAQVVALGDARATRYALLQSIRGLPAQQPIWWTDEAGGTSRIGTLSHLSGGIVHVETALTRSTTDRALPWFLTTLQVQGFLGRLLARRLSSHGVDGNPERWDTETVLYGALHVNDPPGAIGLGELTAEPIHVALPLAKEALGTALDSVAADVANTAPAGSSAGGEQPKFVARFDDGRHVLVKFTPPLGTPFGDRWRDLLYAEALASDVLRDHGVAVAKTAVVESGKRAYLLSERFDRIGRTGRRHVVAIGAMHTAFVASSYRNWAWTCEALARQRRLSKDDAARAAALQHFGRLIGNSDMHSGNLSLIVQPGDLAQGRGTLAPVYDMLPMRWRPDAALGWAPDYDPFVIDGEAAASAAVAPAHMFWGALSTHPDVSRALRRVAVQMADKVSTRS